MRCWGKNSSLLAALNLLTFSLKLNAPPPSGLSGFRAKANTKSKRESNSIWSAVQLTWKPKAKHKRWSSADSCSICCSFPILSSNALHSFNLNLHVVSSITEWRQSECVGPSPSWGLPIAEVNTFAAMSEQVVGRKWSYRGDRTAGRIILRWWFPKKEVRQLWKQNSTWPWKVNSRYQPKSSTLRSETLIVHCIKVNFKKLSVQPVNQKNQKNSRIFLIKCNALP